MFICVLKGYLKGFFIVERICIPVRLMCVFGGLFTYCEKVCCIGEVVMLMLVVGWVVFLFSISVFVFRLFHYHLVMFHYHLVICFLFWLYVL